jgi:hypothetical protein
LQVQCIDDVVEVPAHSFIKRNLPGADRISPRPVTADSIDPNNVPSIYDLTGPIKDKAPRNYTPPVDTANPFSKRRESTVQRADSNPFSRAPRQPRSSDNPFAQTARGSLQPSPDNSQDSEEPDALLAQDVAPDRTGSSAIARARAVDCPEDLKLVQTALPYYRDPMLAQVRSAVASQTVRQAISAAKAQGLSSTSAVSALYRQASSDDNEARRAAKCASELNSALISPESFYQDGKAGHFSNQNCHEGTRAACICQMVQYQIGATTNRALADAFACHIRYGNW